MSAAKSILQAGVTLQAAGLAGQNLKLLEKKNIKSKDFVKQGVRNIFGASIIGAQSNIINQLD